MDRQQEVVEILAARGVRLRIHWIHSRLQELIQREGILSAEAQAEKCFAEFLAADLNIIGAPVLPPDLHSIHKAELPGPYILQVDEVSDIGYHTRERYQERNAGLGNRCLKLSMTDGAQRVFGIEYRPVPQLKVFLPAGSKIAVRDVCVRRGLFLLVPEILVVLGGVVEQLEMARERVVEHVNKPPRGNRNPRGVAPPRLAEQLSDAAWPAEEPDAQLTHQTQRFQEPEPQAFQMNAPETPAEMFEEPESFSPRGFQPDSFTASSSTTVRAESVRSESENARAFSQHSVSVRTTQLKKLSMSQQTLHSVFERRETEASRASSRDENSPFTYLAFLQKRFQETGIKQAGRIKCFLTCVKSFRFNLRDHFLLLVHVDDGSLITVASMDHEIVQSLVGHTPAEVNTALGLKGTEEFRQMKNKLDKFQDVLRRFQGYMDVEWSDDACRITAMQESIPANEAWLLLHRVENLQNQATQVMDISP